ncbi:hypothetical protein ACFLQI_01445 [Candidatus Undinarchaeota archaeon]
MVDLIIPGAAMALTLFVIGVLANYSGIVKKAEKGFEFIIAGAFLYIFTAALQYTMSFRVAGIYLVELSATFGILLALVAMASSILALFCVLMGALYAVEELSHQHTKRKK